MYSLVIPVYNNSGSIPELLEALAGVNRELGGTLEVVFVVDGSPDDSYEKLRTLLPEQAYASRLLILSRNYGSFAAIREGLRAARGKYFAVMAADLQEPPALAVEFFRTLEKEAVDLVLGRREHRADPLTSRLGSSVFWTLYCRLVQRDMPTGGVDVFGCNLAVRDRLLSLEEANSSLVGLLLWMGYRRKLVGYPRLPRRHGKSGWTLKRKVRYLSDSIFAFSDLPVRLLVLLGVAGLSLAIMLSLVVLVAKLIGRIEVPGYTATVLTVAFFAGLNSLGLGVIGSYVWRAFENTKRRPLAIVMDTTDFGPHPRG